MAKSPEEAERAGKEYAKKAYQNSSNPEERVANHARAVSAFRSAANNYAKIGNRVGENASRVSAANHATEVAEHKSAYASRMTTATHKPLDIKAAHGAARDAHREAAGMQRDVGHDAEHHIRAADDHAKLAKSKSPKEAALTKLGGGINSQAHQRAHSAGVSVEAKAASGEAARREFAGASDKELYGLHEKAHGLHKEAAATHPDRAMRSIHRDEARGHASAMGMLKAGIDKGEKVTLNRELAKGAVSEYIGKKVQEANKSKANEMSKAAHIVSGQAKEAGAGASKSSHKFAGETHLEAAKLQKVAGNPVAEARHLAKAGEHASNAGGAWDEAKHPRDKDGKFGG